MGLFKTDSKYPHIIYALKLNGKRFWRHLIICISIRKNLGWKLDNRCVCWFLWILCPLADDGKLSFEEFKAYFADGILTTDELRELFYSIDGRQTKYILQPQANSLKSCLNAHKISVQKTCLDTCVLRCVIIYCNLFTKISTIFLVQLIINYCITAHKRI